MCFGLCAPSLQCRQVQQPTVGTLQVNLRSISANPELNYSVERMANSECKLPSRDGAYTTFKQLLRWIDPRK